jgi:plastocyanin
MKRLTLVLCVGATLPLLQAGPALAPNGHDVNVYDNGFYPGVTRIPVSHGSSEIPVSWTWCESIAPPGCPDFSNDLHNVREDSRLFYSGGVQTDRPTPFERHFSAGTFHYYCEEHGSPAGGMAGLVRVDLLHADAPAGRPFTVRWAGHLTQTGSAFDVRFRVDDGRWRNWKTDIKAFKGTFGRDGRPVRVRPGRDYDFQARSQKSISAGNRRSGWSPILEVLT